jgi:hypothetical protein
MAKFVPSSSIEAIAGSIGNDTYSRVHSCSVIKAKSYPGSHHKYIITPKQGAINTQFGLWAPGWQQISESQRAAWNNFAKTRNVSNSFGKKYNPSGFNLFCSCNNNLALIGQFPIVSVPVVPVIIQLQAFFPFSSLTVPGSLTINFPDKTTDAHVYYLIYCSKQLSPGISYCKNSYRLIGNIPPGQTNSFSILALYENVFGSLESGKKIFYKLIPVHSLCGFTGITLYNSLIN